MRFIHSIKCWGLFLLLQYPGYSPAQLITKKQGREIVAKLPRPKAPDKEYIGDYTSELTTRVFGSRKYTTYRLHDKGYENKIIYRPNSPFNIGVGMNYRLIGINLGFNLPLINQTSEYGKTRFLDLQTHLYGRRMLIDFYGQYYKGYYINNSAVLLDNKQVYIRPDLRTFNVGSVVQYLVNGDKFSFKAAYLQNEVQLKSAGSLILGGAASLVHISADSSVIPGNLAYADFYNNYHFNRSAMQSITANIGYAYTWVLPYDFFVTASLLGGVGANHSSLRNIALKEYAEKWGSEFNATVRIALGYNSRRYFAGLHYVSTRATSSAPVSGARQEFGSGNFRVSVATRWPLKKKLLGFY